MNLLDTVQVLHAPVTAGAYGSQTPNWAGASTTTYRANVQPYSRRSTGLEQTSNQQRVDYRLRCFLPGNASVVSTDRVVWRGNTYEVGGIDVWSRGIGPMHHFELELSLVTGG